MDMHPQTATTAVDLSVAVGSLQLRNPILVASGTFGYAREAAPFVDLAKLGGIVPKTITLHPRAGNAPPRVAETASGMLNAIGLDNDGIEYFLSHHWPLLRDLPTPIILNIAGKSVAEFHELAARLSELENLAGVELNLSCPNVAGGIDYAIDPQLTAAVVAGCRTRLTCPIWAKLTPNIHDIVPVARAAWESGADAVTLVNTFLGMAVDWRRRRPILSATFGGLSGPAIKPLALRVVWQVRRALAVPIVGVGGIQNVQDVLEFLVAGASAVQVGTANFFDPSVSGRLIQDLAETLAKENIFQLRELIGTLQTS